LYAGADRLRSGIAVQLLGRGIPESDPALQIGADDSHRRCIDDRGERVFGFLQLELPLSDGLRHAVERIRDVADLVVGLHRRSMR
jgi:hypothetical protein